MKVMHNQQSFTWNGKVWLDASFLQVHEALAVELCDRFLIDVLDVSSPDWFRQSATLRQAASDRHSTATLRLVERACRRRLQRDPQDAATAAIPCSCLRQLGQPKQALLATEPLSHRSVPALLVSRAAALCDLARWDEAAETVQRALHCGGGAFALQVRNRIRNRAG